MAGGVSGKCCCYHVAPRRKKVWFWVRVLFVWWTFVAQAVARYEEPNLERETGRLLQTWRNGQASGCDTGKKSLMAPGKQSPCQMQEQGPSRNSSSVVHVQGMLSGCDIWWTIRKRKSQHRQRARFQDRNTEFTFLNSYPLGESLNFTLKATYKATLVICRFHHRL